MQDQIDIFISGAGPAGLIAAAGFAALGLRVLIADPAPPVTDAAAPGSDLRSTAFLQPARALFDRIGLWPDLAAHAVPLKVLEIVDTTGTPPQIRNRRAFRGDDMGDGGATPLGWNFANWRIRQVLMDHLARQPGVEIASGCGFARQVSRESRALVTLTDGRRIAARLAIAADGRNSPLREAAGIGVKTARYGQKALAFAVTHPLPHDGTSIEIYHQGGPFTMVPLADHLGLPASAVVWMNPGPETQRLAALDRDAFDAAMTGRSAGVLGPLSLIGGRAVWPVVTQRAARLTGQRVALIAEAAHVLPPIGAQGLNTSVNDIAALVDLAESRPDGIGDAAWLDSYAKARAGDIAARARAIDLFNRVTRSPDSVAQALRGLGLRALHDIAPLRQAIMKAGMGPG